MSSALCCRSCDSTSLRLILDLGDQPLANNLLLPSDLDKPEPRFSLQLYVCPDCWLIQIGELVPPVELFSEYLYFSSFSDTMLLHARQAASDHIAQFQLGQDSLVVEIASNDGYLLKNFKAANIPCLGIEPASNIAKVARDQGIETLVEFFGGDLAGKLASEGKQADLILGNNVFAHAPVTNDFVAGLQRLLKPSGAIVLEFPHGQEMLLHNEFDTIYHEHVFYFTVLALRPLFARHGLEIFDVKRLSIHGGSLRLYVAHTGAFPISSRVEEVVNQELAEGLASMAVYESFAQRAYKIRDDLVALTAKIRDEGGSVAAYGASAKGSTLCNFCGLDAGIIKFVADRSTYKLGRLTPGTHIPIVTPETLSLEQPDYTLLLTWNFSEEILAQQKAYREAGGRFIIPIPEVKVI